MKFIKILLVLLVLFILGFAVTWNCSLRFQERILWLGMMPLTPAPIQRLTLENLRKHPTTATALALVIYTNLKYSYPRRAADLAKLAAEQCQAETDEAARKTCTAQELERLTLEEEARAKDRQASNALAEEAVKTLCVLSGETFGSYYEKNQWGFSWGSLSDERWSTVLTEMNLWTFRQFGMEALAGAGLAALAQEISLQIKQIPQAVDLGTVVVNFSDASTNLADAVSSLPDTSTSGMQP